MTRIFADAKPQAMNRRRLTLFAALLLPTTEAAAQILPTPSLPPPLGGLVRDLGGVVTDGALMHQLERDARTLARERLERLRNLGRRHPDHIDLDRDGNPVRAREILVEDPNEELVKRATALGFPLLETQNIGDLGISYARFGTPKGMSLRAALERMGAIAAGHQVTTDPLHFASGSAAAVGTYTVSRPLVDAMASNTTIGIIDGGIDSRAIVGRTVQQAFATGGPAPNAHATALASLIQGTSAVRGAALGARLLVADVYGRDPAGGSATAIAQAIGWMVRQRVPVVAVSLVGPPNSLLGRVLRAARARGTIIVAAVGNDGPAAPPAYPASYPEALAVTGVDSRNRALIEAGRARHLDYAAPGADMLAAGLGGRAAPVRGTSFAVPFVTARLARFYAEPNAAALSGALRALDGEARDLGKRGGDPIYGRGLVCGDCRTPKK
jgi:hypothetical protein